MNWSGQPCAPPGRNATFRFFQNRAAESAVQDVILK
jgi:hypothetical protein